jgi:hypothetical protein
MSLGKAFINNKDIYGVFGASLIRSSYEELLTSAPAKEFTENKFRSDNGKQIFFDNPRDDERDLQLTFFIEGSNVNDYLSKYDNFLKEVKENIVNLRIPLLKTTYKLTYKDCNKYGDYGYNAGSFVLDFNEPNPKDRVFD